MGSTCGPRGFCGRSAVLVMVLVFAHPAWGAGGVLIEENGPNAAAGPAGAPPQGFPPARRSRPVSLSPLIASPDLVGPGDTLTLNLFDDAAYTARIDQVSVNVLGTISVRGRIDGHPLGYLLISTTGARSLASIRVPEQNRHFAIQSEPLTRQHFLIDVDDDQLDILPCDHAPIPPPPTEEEAESIEALPRSANGPLDPATIDVMIVYTPAARNWANVSGGGIANVIANAMESAQLSHANSNTILTLNLLHAAEVDYTETGDGSTDLNRLTSLNDGHMDEVHAWRDQHGADLVALFTNVSAYGGIAWLLNTTAGRPDRGFSVTRIQQAAASSYTHAHELGHNMGCHHHKEQNFQPGPGLFSYSAGWRWTGTNNGRYCSVMAYTGGQYYADGLTHSRVAHFSNPSIPFWNVATGHAADGDNATTIRATKEVIASYRVRNHRPETPLLLSPADGATGVHATPILTASAYVDPDGHPHASSQWQVALDTDFASVAWDSGENHPPAAQTSVPPGQLSRNVFYHWRVRYKDSRHLWSEWSSPRSFRTNYMPGDFDEDGDVDQEDFGAFQLCFTGQFIPQADPACIPALMDTDNDVDEADFILFYRCMTRANVPADPACAD